MKRFDIMALPVNYFGEASAELEIEESEKGEWVKYDDIKHLLQKTAHNRDCAQCQHEYEYVNTTPFIGYKCKKCGHCI